MIPNDIRRKITNATSAFLTSYTSLIADPNLSKVYFGNREVNLKQVEDDPHVSSCIQQRKAGALSLEYEIQYDDTNKHLQPFFDKVIYSLDIQRVINDCLDALLYGFNVAEITWDYTDWDGRKVVIPTNLNSKPRSWFNFDGNKILRMNDSDNTLLPRYKFLLIQHQATYENPYGKSLLSKCLWPVIFKKADITFWMMFAEVYGMPKFVGTTTYLRGTDQFDDFFTSLENLIQDGKLVLGIDESITELNPATNANIDVYKEMIEVMNKEISKVWLSETLTTDIGATGSYSASNTHFNVLKMVTQFDARMVEGAIKDLLKWIRNFNFGQEVNVPEFVMYESQDVDRPLAEVVQILESNKNIKFTKKFYQERFGFKSDEFELLENAPSTTPFSQQHNVTRSHQQNNFALSSALWDQILIDSFGDKLVNDDDFGEDLKTKLSAFLSKHDDYESAIANIAKLLPDMPSQKIEEVLTNALFIADVTGRLSVQEEVKNG